MTPLKIDRRRFVQILGCGCALGAAGGLSALLDACGGSTAASRSSSPTLPRVRVRAYDFRFDAPAQVPAGLVEVELENLGQSPHAVVAAKIKDGVSYDQVRIATMKGPGANVKLLDAILGGTDLVGTAPGGRQTVRILFDEGQFIWESNALGTDGVRDIAKGMVAPFEVVASSSSTTPPPTSLKVLLTDTGPQLPAGVRRGAQVWEVAGNSAAHRLHSLSVARFAPGKTVADWLAWRKQQVGSSPIEELTGVNVLGQGNRSAWLPLNLSAGSYVAYCSVVLPELKQDHIANGEVVAFTVS